MRYDSWGRVIPAGYANPGGASAVENYGYGSGNFSAPQIKGDPYLNQSFAAITPFKYFRAAIDDGIDRHLASSYLGRPSAALADMGLAGISCAEWSAMNWNNRLASVMRLSTGQTAAEREDAARAAADMLPIIRYFRSGLPSADESRLARQIDTFCSPQSPYVSEPMYTPVDSGFFGGASPYGVKTYGDAGPASFGVKTYAAGQAAPSGMTTWWNSEPIKLTSKNYVLGFVSGAAVGALAMHLSMSMMKKKNKR